MAISPPNFQKDAIPTPQGWRHPRTNELLVSRKITADEINEYFGGTPKELVQILTEAPTNFQEAKDELISEDDLESKTKLELEAIGREHGVELDRRKNKADLIEELKEVI